MVDPTPIETIVALVTFSAIVIVFLSLVFGLLNAVGRLTNRMTNSSADVDVRVLMAEEMHLHRDPTAPTAEYGAVNEAREHLRKRG